MPRNLNQPDRKKSENGPSINELGERYIVTNSLTAPQNNDYIDGGYFLAPLIKYSTMGLMAEETDSGINDDGANYLALSNLFDTHLKTMKLNLHYSSDDSRDKFNKIFGLWRSSFTSYIDFKVDYDGANIKSKTYDTARNACEQGFADIGDALYRGLLSNAYTVYDAGQNLCIIRENGQDLGSFNVWNIDTGIVGDFHYLTKPSGQVLVFSRDGEGYVADDRGINVSMYVNEDGTYEYIDASGFVNTYSIDGKLAKIMFEGQETTLSYDESYKLTRVEGPLETSLVYQYADNESLASIEFGEKEARFFYNENNQLISIDIATDEITNDEQDELDGITEEGEYGAADSIGEEDLVSGEIVADDAVVTDSLAIEESINVYNLARFTYDEKGRLVALQREEVADVDDPEQTISAGSNRYVYDELNRVTTVENSTGEGLVINYQPKMVKRLFYNGNEVIHEMSFAGSKQQIKVIDDHSSKLDGTYNRQGQLTNIELAEEPDTDASGNIVTQGRDDGKKRLEMSFAYNVRGLINKIQYSSVSSGKKFVQLEYKSRYPKPTKVLTNDEVTFFDFNQEGQLIKKTSIKFDKEMRLRAAAVTQAEVLSLDQRYEKTYIYDESGFLIKIKNEVDGASKSYEVDENGQIKKKIRIQEEWFWGGWWSWWNTWSNAASREGWTATTGYIDVTEVNVQTVFVGGARDSKKGHLAGSVEHYAANSGNQNGYSNYYSWRAVDSFLGLDVNQAGIDPFKKVRDKLVVIGHSWGGDSAVEASKQTLTGGMVDLLITVDPVGVGDHYDGAKYWIQLYAQAGRPHGGYLSWKKKYRTINIPYYRCRRHRWHFHCGWSKRKTKVYYWYIGWVKTMKWDSGDWTAFAGGKGWYGSYDPGDAFPDQLIKIPAHHSDFRYMLWKMEHGAGNKPNNRFGITINAGYKFDDKGFVKLQKDYGAEKADYGIGFWK